jgi:hypothetical protein
MLIQIKARERLKLALHNKMREIVLAIFHLLQKRMFTMKERRFLLV